MARRPGPQGAPTELKLLRGNPGKRSLKDRAQGVIPADIPAPPEHLRGAGRAAWDLYWQHGRAWLAETDIPVLTQLCEYHDLRDDIKAAIDREGLIHLNTDTGRSFTHHLFNDLRGIDATIRDLWSVCYMTPTDRGRAQIAPATKDPLETWMESNGR